MYYLMTFSIFKELYIHHHNKLGDIFINPKRNLIPSLSITPIPRQPLICFLFGFVCSDAFELCSRKLLRVPWTARRSNQSSSKGNQSWIFIERTDAEAETPILWPPDGKSDLLEETLMLGKIEGGRKRGWQRMRWLDGITRWTWVWVNSGSWWWTGKPGVLQSMGLQSHTWMSDWTDWLILGISYTWHRITNIQPLVSNFFCLVYFKVHLPCSMYPKQCRPLLSVPPPLAGGGCWRLGYFSAGSCY